MTYFQPAAFFNKTDDRKQNGKTLLLSQVFSFNSIKTAAERLINCDFCSKTFANKENFFRQLRNFQHGNVKVTAEKLHVMSFQRVLFGCNEKNTLKENILQQNSS